MSEPKVETRSKTSQALTNLRAFAIVMVVSFHSVLGYLASQPVAPRPFDDPALWIATPILDSQRWLGFDIYAAFQYVSLMPVMFFLSGVFVWPSLRRKGSGRFLYDRLRRIGLPFVLGVYALMPFAYYPVYRLTAIDPGWLAYFRHLVALPFWPSGPLWFLWELLAFDIVAVLLYRVAPRSGDLLARLSGSAGEAPGRYFLVLLGVSAAAYLPLAFVFGAGNWQDFGPFALQPDRVLLYLVYFFAGVGIGAGGYDRGLLRADGVLVRRWPWWLGGAIASFLLWMISMAPSFYGHSGVLLDFVAYLAVVLAVATACLAFAAVFVRFASGRWAIAESLAANAYAIYLVHYVFVIWLQYAFLGAALPAIVKGMSVFAGALVLSWGTAAAFGRLSMWTRFIRGGATGPLKADGSNRNSRLARSDRSRPHEASWR
jgi:peptidoglycan/LPS O-acetylase OafA/YrhL